MKPISKMFLGVVALTLMACFQSCSDDMKKVNTLNIEITPSEIILTPGDQTALSCRVTNGSGNVVDTPVTWSVVDEAVAEIIPMYEQGEGSSLIGYAVRALNDSKGKRTSVRATLDDGSYAEAPLSVVAPSVEGALSLITDNRRSYISDGFDTVWVKVIPAALIDDCLLSYKPKLPMYMLRTKPSPVVNLNLSKVKI